MKFIATLLVLIIGVYFGADYLLSSHLKTTPTTAPADEKVLVQNMAKFLETSPDLQKKITDSGQVVAKPTAQASPTPSEDEVDLEKVSRYFGNTPADQYFKKYLVQKKKMNPDDADEQTKVFVDVSGYLHKNPKEAVESLENAIQSIPQDQTAEREAIVPVFIHSAINYIDDLQADDSTKKAYLKRFIDNTQDPEVKDALESHFPDLLNPPEAPPEVH